MESFTPAVVERSNVVTLCSIAIIAYIIANVLHEAVGHGGMCLLVGGTPKHLSTADFDGNYDTVSDVGRRMVAAGGTLINLFASVAFGFALKQFKSVSHRIQYFLWLSMSINYFVAAGYPLFSGVIGVGDWIAVIEGYQHPWLWRIGLSLIGFFSYGWGVWYSLTILNTMIGSANDKRFKSAALLTVPAYLAGSIATTISAVLNPIGSFVFFTSAAGHFGGTSAFAWMTQLLKKEKWFPKQEHEGIIISKSFSWIIVCMVLLSIHIFVLGPSIRFIN